jgi:hypothetical protein
MAKFKQLHDLYRFPGFVPFARIHGVFGDPQAVVITLQRRRKKRFAVSVVRSITVTTTNGPDVYAISLVATNVSTSPSNSAGSSVPGVAA